MVEAATVEVEEREAAWVEGTEQVGTEAVLGVTARAVREAEKAEREVGWVREAAREEAAVAIFRRRRCGGRRCRERRTQHGPGDSCPRRVLCVLAAVDA